MIPILYDAAETAYTTQGLGRLPDAISCIVDEERNGAYTLTMRYPVTGLHYTEIELGRQIMAVPAYGKDPEPFRVVKITKPFDGVVTVFCNHLSYDLKKITVGPFTAASCAGAFTAMAAASLDTLPFTFWTDKDVAASYANKKPAAVRSLLGGESNSFLDVFGTGEYEFIRRQVKLWLHRGSDKGVSIRYGKNLTDLESITDNEDTFASVVPYWESVDGNEIVIGNKITSGHESEFPWTATIPLNLSESFEEAPTVAQLDARATAYLTNNKPWEIKQNITISFVNLADTEEYKNVASLQAVNLCDTVHVYHPGLDVSASAKVIRTKYNALLDRYDEVELGNPKLSLQQAIAPVTKTELDATVAHSSSFLSDSMEELINALAGADGGYIKFVRSADGHISEIYCMDTDDESTAVNVLRINHLGIYASTNGINGTYNLAVTTGGTINASQVLTGSLRAIEISNGNGTFYVSSAGEMSATSGAVGGWTLSNYGLSKEVEISGDKYRTVIRNPRTTDSTGTWIFSAEKYNPDTGNWVAQFYLSLNGDSFARSQHINGTLNVAGTATFAQANFSSGNHNVGFFSDTVSFSQNTQTSFWGPVRIADEVKGINNNPINVTAGVNFTGAESHAGTETHSGAITNSGAVTNSGRTNLTDINLASSATWLVGGTGWSGTVQWYNVADVNGNWFKVPGLVPS